MKFFTVFSAILASGTALAASVPNTRSVSSNLATRNVEVQASPETRDVKDDITSFFDSIIPTSDDKSQTPEEVEKRDVLGNIVGGVKNLVPGTESTDYNQLISHGFNVTAEYVGSIDLNAKLTAGIEAVAGKVTSSIPGASIITSLLSGFKLAVGKVDLNAWASSGLAIVGKFVATTDFNAAVTTAIKFCKSIAAQVSAGGSASA